MESKEIKANDVVLLKSGGPEMTVKEVKDGKAVCVWFHGGVIVESMSFEVGMLKHKPSLGLGRGAVRRTDFGGF